MKALIEQDYVINICTDIIEWAKEFYAMPEGAEIANEEEVSSECMGFAAIDTRAIWLFIPKEDLKEIIAHEVGHIIELKYPNNFEQGDENDELHELKADHYMNYYLLVDTIVKNVVLELQEAENR